MIISRQKEQDYANHSSEVAGSLLRAAAAIMVLVLTVVQKNAAHPGNQKLLALEIMPQILFGQYRLDWHRPGTNFLRWTSSCEGPL